MNLSIHFIKKLVEEKNGYGKGPIPAMVVALVTGRKKDTFDISAIENVYSHAEKILASLHV